MSFLSGILESLFDHNGGGGGGFAFDFISQGPGGISSLSSQLWGISIGEALAAQNNFTFGFDTNLDDLPVEQPTLNGPIMREYHPSDSVPEVNDLPPSQNIQLRPWIDEHGHLTRDVSFDSFDQGDFNWLSAYSAANGYDWA